MSIFPINWQDKVNSPQLLAFLQQFGEQSYLSAEEINQIRDALNYLSNLSGVGSGITNDTGFSFVDTDFVINALFAWKFNGTDFVLDEALEIPVPYAATSKHRTDVIVARNGNIIKLTGLETEIDVPAPAPTYNLQTDLYITQFEVNESGYGDVSPPVTGNLYTKKSDAQNVSIPITGSNKIVQLPVNGESYIVFTGATLVSIAGFTITDVQELYNNKPFIFYNNTPNPVTFINDSGILTGSQIPLLSRKSTDIIVPAGEFIFMFYNAGGFIDGVKSWSEGGDSSSFQYNTGSLCIFNFPATSNWTQQGGFFGMGAYGSARSDSGVSDFLTLIASSAYNKVIGGIAPYDMKLTRNLSCVTQNNNLIGGDLVLAIGWVNLNYSTAALSDATLVDSGTYTPNANGLVDLREDFDGEVIIPKGAIWCYSWAHTKASAVSSVYIQTILNFEKA